MLSEPDILVEGPIDGDAIDDAPPEENGPLFLIAAAARFPTRRATHHSASPPRRGVKLAAGLSILLHGATIAAGIRFLVLPAAPPNNYATLIAGQTFESTYTPWTPSLVPAEAPAELPPIEPAAPSPLVHPSILLEAPSLTPVAPPAPAEAPSVTANEPRTPWEPIGVSMTDDTMRPNVPFRRPAIHPLTETPDTQTTSDRGPAPSVPVGSSAPPSRKADASAVVPPRIVPLSPRRAGRRGVDARGLPVPEYPPEAKRLGQDGLVELRVEILPDGSVGTIAVLSDPGFPLLVQSAAAALRDARFAPGTQDGKPTTAYLVIPFRFSLN